MTPPLRISIARPHHMHLPTPPEGSRRRKVPGVLEMRRIARGAGNQNLFFSTAFFLSWMSTRSNGNAPSSPPRAGSTRSDQTPTRPFRGIKKHALDIGPSDFDDASAAQLLSEIQGRKKQQKKDKTHRSAGRAGSNGLAAAGAAERAAEAGRARAAREERAICIVAGGWERASRRRTRGGDGRRGKKE